MPTEEYPWRSACVRLEAEVARLQGEIERLRAVESALLAVSTEDADEIERLETANHMLQTALGHAEADVAEVTRERDEARKAARALWNDDGIYNRCISKQEWPWLEETT